MSRLDLRGGTSPVAASASEWTRPVPAACVAASASEWTRPVTAACVAASASEWARPVTGACVAASASEWTPRIRHHNRPLLWLAAAAAAITPSPLARADVFVPVTTEPGSNIIIKISSPVSSVPHFGFMPLRVAVENGTARDGTWHFRFDAGSRAVFPGITTTAMAIDVSAGQSRETWVFVPLAVPAITFNPAALTPTRGTAAAPALPVAPPAIPGVYPNPKLPGVTYYLPPPAIKSTVLGPTRVFTIRQTGPANLLPPIAPRDLPPGVTVTVSPPDPSGNVVRTTTATIEVRPPMSIVSSGSPASSATNNARQLLTKAGLMPPGVSTRTSSRTSMGRASGYNEVSVTIVQTGPERELPLTPLAALPKGFTSVNVSPDPASGDVVREFTYVEQVPVSTIPSMGVGSPGTGAVIGGGFSVGRSGLLASSSSAAEAEARRILAPTGLLETKPPVRTSRSTQMLPMPSGPGAGPYRLFLFEQTGPAALLPQPAPASLPPGVKCVVYPVAGGTTATRIITVIEPAVVSALYAGVAGPAGASPSSTSQATSLARVELQRLGLLRAQPGVSQSTSFRHSSGSSTSAPNVFIFAESGPPAMLPQVGPATLPAGVTCSVSPGPLSGEVTRNFIVQMPVFLAGAGGGVPVRVATAPPVRYTTSAPTVPGSLVIDMSGPGVPAGGQRAVFPNAIGNTAMPPIATTPPLEPLLRAKMAGAGIGALPNLSGFEAAHAPADWRVWSSFNSVVLRSTDWTALDPARRAALRSWVALGGVLYLFPEVVTGSAGTERLGAGRIETLADPLAVLEPVELVDSIRLKETSPGMPERERAKLQPGTPMGDIVRFHPPETLWLSVLLGLFAIAIGPVNLIWLAPAARRHRLFLTTPLISLAGAAAVVAVILLQDGLGGEGIRRALVVLVPGEHQAAVFQEQAARSGYLLQRRFPLDDGVIAAVLPTEEALGLRGLHPGTFGRERGRADGDWFRNRTRQAHLLRTLAPTRARVEVVDFSATGAPVIESTVPVPLREFRLRDDRGAIWGAAAVATGRRTILQLQSRFEAAAKASQAYGGNGTGNFGGLVMEATTLADPWQWSALGAASELAPIATLASIRWHDEDIIYAGIAPAATRRRTASAGSAAGALAD